jgi:tRNA/rRNA methyltransferase
LIPPDFSITMVEPQYPVNVGYVARLAKNFGVSKLYFVSPRFDISTSTIYASHAYDIIESSEIITLEELRKKCDVLIATTSVRAKKASNVIRQSLTPELLSDYLGKNRASLVLGREGTGLTNEEIRYCDVTVTIDTGTKYNTLNISHATAIILYVISRRNNVETRRSRQASDVFLKYYELLLRRAKLPVHKERNLREIAKKILFLSGLSDRELMMLVGLIRRALE